MSMNWSSSVRSWHRWLSVIIGLQLLLWTVSGLVMTWNAIEDVRGEGWVAEPSPPIPANLDIEPPSILPEGTADLRFRWSRERWTWHALDGDGETLGVFDGQSGQLLADMDGEEATALAARIFTGQGAPVAATLIRETAADDEYRNNPLPAWRVSFDDPENTAVYLATDTGTKTKVRTDSWRLFDFFWMLHIMDYEARTDFNHPLLQVAAGTGVATSLTGVWLAVLVLWPRRRRPS